MQVKTFLKNSTILFFGSLFASGINFLIQPLAARFLVKDFDLWVVLTGLLSVVLTLISGLTTEVIRETATLSEKNSAFNYYLFLKNNLFKASLYIAVITPILAIFLNILLLANNYILVLTTLLVVIASIFLTLNQSFLLGMLDVKIYTLSQISTGIFRLAFTALFFWLNFNLFALPFGLILSSLIPYFFTEKWIITKYYNQNKTDENSVKYDFLSQIFKFLKTSSVLFAVSLLLQIPILISRNFLTTGYNSELFAVIAVLGNILFFGIASFLSGIIAHAARSKDLKIYYLSLLIVISIGTFGTLILYFINPFIVDVILKKSYLNADLWLFVWYSLSILVYSLINMSIQYLIAKNKNSLEIFYAVGILAFIYLIFYVFKDSIRLSVILEILVNSTVSSKNSISLVDNQVLNLILVSLVVKVLTFIYFFIKIIKTQETN
jgi:O-antigen/teichoic acid export membrane protein